MTDYEPLVKNLRSCAESLWKITCHQCGYDNEDECRIFDRHLLVDAADAIEELQQINYYNKVRNGRHFHTDTEVELLKYLECIADKGLDTFHKMAKESAETIVPAEAERSKT